MELADADARFTITTAPDAHNSNPGSTGDGTVGSLTNRLITRTDYYVHTLMLALIPLVRSELYDTEIACSSK
jgi:hypothetical protein